MCGIAGLISRKPGTDRLPPMLRSLSHRGPDGEGTFADRARDWHVALGHRRLSIIDLEGGIQPMGNEDGRVVVTFNGEIFDFRDHRKALLRAGHTFRTQSDTEVLVHLYEQNGTSSASQLNGMFAYAIWDQNHCRLFLARDRAGIKPLYYASLPDGGLVFASELTALLAEGSTKVEPDPAGLASFLFSDYAHAPHTLVSGARKLAPGTFLTWENGVLSDPVPYFRPPLPTPSTESRRDLGGRIWTVLGDSVERQLVSDVPVGIFLSGGLDSSSVAWLASRRSPGKMQCFSIGFDNPAFDEGAYARAAAKHVGLEVVEERFTESTLLSVFDETLGKLDEPMADPSILPTFLLSRLAARHLKVVLGGDGGDELFGGYPTYRAHLAAAAFARLPEQARKRLGSWIDKLPIDDRYQSLEWKMRRFVHRFAMDPIERHLRWMSSLDWPELIDALGSRVEPVAAMPIASEVSEVDTPDLLRRMLALDFSSYLPGSVLAKVDRASMAHGLEVRPPFLDNAMIDLAFSIPSHEKVSLLSGKRILKESARRSLPSEIIDRPKKGFAIPLARWLQGPLLPPLEVVLHRSPVWDAGWLNPRTYHRFANEHREKRKDRSKPLYALLVLDRWLRRVL